MEINSFIQKAADKTGFRREKYELSRLPTDPTNITVLPFFGDLRSLFVLSSLVLPRLQEEYRHRYFILCSWSGFAPLFPTVDEYWGLENYTSYYYDTNVFPIRNLNQFFFEDVVLDAKEINKYHDKGFTDLFWGKVNYRILPAIEADKKISILPGHKVFIFPNQFAQHYLFKKLNNLKISEEFWVRLINRLIKEKYKPVVYQGQLTHKLTNEFSSKSVCFSDKNIFESMRACSCVLDFFSGISKLAQAVRRPFVAVDERSRYNAYKEYEIDDLCCTTKRQYIFSFPTILNTNGGWDLLEQVILKLSGFPEIAQDKSDGISKEMVSGDQIRKKKHLRLGLHLIKKRG